MEEQINNCLSAYHKLGDIVFGKFVKIEPTGVWVDIGLEELIFIKNKHIDYLKQDSVREIITINEVREFIVIKEYRSDCNYQLILSLGNLQSDRNYCRIKQLQKEDVTIYTEVFKAYPYGILVNIEAVDFFVSNIYLNTQISNEDLVGTIIPLKFIPNIMILSHSLAINPEQKQYLPRDIVIGKVIKLESDCAWIDIGLEKLAYIHISEMWNRPNSKIKLSQDILYLNQVRDFTLVHDNYHYGLISLSIKKIHHQIIAKRLEQIHQENITIYATVIASVTQGVIVYVEELLSNIRPFFLGFDLNSENLVGKRLALKIMHLQTSNNYTSEYHDFTLMHDCDDVRARIKKYQVGKIVTATIRCIKSYRLLVNINNPEDFRLSAIIKKNEISQFPINNIEDNFKINQVVKAKIIEADITLPRFSLSIKALEVD